MTRIELARWIEAYERAWRTPGTALLTELFAPDATYRPAPFDEPLRGFEAVAALAVPPRSAARRHRRGVGLPA